ncbi:PAAR domain-containing protein [Aeromonas popoffii]|uniref:PAAR domain-containing protein n=1 Tax=Aeromonas popoffii TaxID=70856 RepID=UPI0020120DF9|nr:PAAR domain-containing protein [Aeromonas popoffii]
MSKKAATVGDIGTDHDGFPPTPIIEGSQDIIIDNKPAARVGDATTRRMIER